MKLSEPFLKVERRRSKMLNSLNTSTQYKENVFRNSEDKLIINEHNKLKSVSGTKRKSCFDNNSTKLHQPPSESNRYSTKQNGSECHPALKHSSSQRFSQNMLRRFSDIKPRELERCPSGASIPQGGPKSINSCENHKDRQGKYYTVSSDQRMANAQNISEQSFYCEQCAINLSQMDFSLKRSPSTSKPNTKNALLLDKLLECHSWLSNRIESSKDTALMRTLDCQIEEIEAKFQNIADALAKIKKEEILKLEIKKMEFYEKMSESDNIIQGLKRKITYLISDLGKKIKAKGEPSHHQMNYKEEICHQLYMEVIQKAKVTLNRLAGEGMQVPSFLKNIKIMEQKEIIDKAKGYFQERVHELSFEIEDDNQKEGGLIEEEDVIFGNNTPDMNVLEMSKFEATFGNTSSILRADLEYSKATPREESLEEIRI